MYPSLATLGNMLTAWNLAMTTQIKPQSNSRINYNRQNGSQRSESVEEESEFKGAQLEQHGKRTTHNKSYEARKCLWDISWVNYMNRDARESAYKEVEEDLKVYGMMWDDVQVELEGSEWTIYERAGPRREEKI